MRVLITGADGFLGWHTRVRLRALASHDVVEVDRRSWPLLSECLAGIDAVLHLAGVNRGTPPEVEEGNVDLAHQLAGSLRRSGTRPVIVYANSIHAHGETPYGIGKRRAAEVLSEAARDIGSRLVDLRLPNLFGEHGRPHYNSFVATFVDAVIQGNEPDLIDRPVELLHVQQAAAALLRAIELGKAVDVPTGTETTVLDVYQQLCRFHAVYQGGDVPPLLTDFDVDIFNTLRAALFPSRYPMPLVARVDDRGALVEAVRAHGGPGQTFVSTTRPGATRGDHFHLRKIERFVVIAGRARISLRRLFTKEIVSFDVEGSVPVVIDMPTMWAHNITNAGCKELTTLFWTHGLFDVEHPDTYAEAVGEEASAVPEVSP